MAALTQSGVVGTAQNKPQVCISTRVRLRDGVDELFVVVARDGKHEPKVFGKEHGPAEALDALMRQLRTGARVIGLETLHNAIPDHLSAGADDCWHAIHPDVPIASAFAFPLWQFEVVRG